MKYISIYNKKYGKDFDIINNIQGDKDDNEIIYKISNYILDSFFDVDGSDDSDDNIEDFDNNVEENEDQKILMEENGKESFDSEKIYFDEFYPKKIIKKNVIILKLLEKITI